MKEVTFDNETHHIGAEDEEEQHHQLTARYPAASLTQLSPNVQRPQHFQLTKQHTGMKNISFNVGAAVSPTDKMEFVQEQPESFGIVKINQPIGGSSKLSPRHPDNGHHDDTHSVASSTGEGITDQGYFDLKFYHNKLW